MSSTSNNYYEQDSTSSYNTLEKVVLAEDVHFSKIINVAGKFYYNAMSPNEDKSSPKDNIKESKSNIKKSNYVSLIIPADLLFAFVEPYFKRLKIDGMFYNVLIADSTEFTIPSGTVFIAELIGGRLELEKLSIVGLYLK